MTDIANREDWLIRAAQHMGSWLVAIGEEPPPATPPVVPPPVAPPAADDKKDDGKAKTQDGGGMQLTDDSGGIQISTLSGGIVLQDASGGINIITSATLDMTGDSVAITGNTGATIAALSGNDITLQSANNLTVTMPTAARGAFCYCIVRQPGSGTTTNTVTFTGVKWPGGTAPTMTTGANAFDRYDFVSDGTNWYATLAGKAFAV